jgi:excisionase family DNA binding protein
MASELAVGLAIAQQMMQQQGGALGGGAAGAPAGAGAAGLPELLTPADAAKALGVGEADVMSVLESGELKGKKIGSAWRIPRAALDAFLAG